MDIEILPFDPINASRDDWDKYHVYREKRHNQIRPEDPFLNNEAVEKSMIVQFQNPEFDFTANRVFEKGNENDLIGTLTYGSFNEESPSYEGNKHIAIFNIELLSEYRKKGIEARLVIKAYEYAKHKGKAVLISGTNELETREFLKEIGAQEDLEGAENRLKLADVDWGMIQSWMTEGPKRASGVELQFFYRVPEEIIENYCRIYTETMNQQPLGELDINDMIFTSETFRRREDDIKKMGIVWLTAISVEQNGDISGLTEMLYHPEIETMISQGLTGVKDTYRGRGLGKWLKAAMIQRVKGEFPKVKIISTGNATTNAAMLSINERMGFTLYKENVNAQITIEDLENYFLSASSA